MIIILNSNLFSVYVIGTEGNLSVGAPFCRGCPNRTIHVINENERVNGPSLSLDEIAAFNKLSNINSFSEFNSLYDKLFSIIKIKLLGKDEDSEVMNYLQELKSRIINSVSGTEKNDFENKWNKLYEMASYGVHNFNI